MPKGVDVLLTPGMGDQVVPVRIGEGGPICPNCKGLMIAHGTHAFTPRITPCPEHFGLLKDPRNKELSIGAKFFHENGHKKEIQNFLIAAIFSALGASLVWGFIFKHLKSCQ